jgi:hypothetical protein
MMTKTYKILLLTVLVVNSVLCLAQPKERLKNRYKESGQKYGAPYTLFDLTNKTLNERLTEIKQLITNPPPDSAYYKIYRTIYSDYFSNTNPSKPVDKTDRVIDPLSLHAKNKAFIALVGVDERGRALAPADIQRL